LNALSLTAEAKNAWTEYLKQDSTSPWAVEARTRLEELRKPTPAEAWAAMETGLQESFTQATAEQATRAHITEARRYIDSTLLPNWAAAVMGDRDASIDLERLRLMADAMQRVTGDPFYQEVVGAIERSSSNGTQRVLANAHEQYARAAIVYSDDQYATARPLLQAAQVALGAANTPYALRAALDLTSLAYLTGGIAEAAATLDASLVTARTHSYAYVEARSTWIQGLLAFVQGRLAEAQAKYEDTLATFERIGDQEQVAASHLLLAGLFYYLGDEHQAWTHYVPALHGLNIPRSLKLRHALLSAASSSLRASDPDAALAIQDEAVRNAHAWGLEAAIAEALALRSSILADLGRNDLALADLREAQQQASANNDPSFRARLEITVLTTESKVLTATRPAAAVKAAQQAIALVEQRKERFRLPQLQLQLANANIVWGRTKDADIALERGIRAFEEQRASLSDEGRVSTRDEAWRLFETAVHIAIKKNDLNRAFALAERARARSLAEARRFPVSRTLESIQASLTDREAIVALNQFDDELALWIIRSSGTEIVTRQLSRANAERLVARQQNEIWQQSASAEAGGALYNEILRPLSNRLTSIERLVVVPDATYESVAFGALWDSSSKRFLLERVAIHLAPSVNAFVAARESIQRASDTTPLVFGGASENSISEARAIASAYRSVAVVAGFSATRTKFFEDLSASRRIVHFAVPLALSASNPLLSRAIVADEPGEPHSGAILGRDIANSKFSNTSLVVIDEVERDPSIRGEGTLSMARAFMAGGVPAVVGTLPGADEKATRDLMIGFHREMSKGIPAEQALQTVQRNAMQQNGRRLGAWTALVLYGSDR
jgi:CHAT domain-containing protein